VIDSIEGAVGIYLASFLIAVASGVIPIVNAEIYLVGVVLAVGGIPEALFLAVLVSVGQMVAKAVIYQTAKGATTLGTKSGGFAAKLERARTRVEKWKSKPLGVTFVSASLGLPPFYIVSLVAGILEVRFRAFLLVGFAGRTLRFGTIALLAALA
jgi:membrane protein YqaA with SNARE-associated domain